MKVNLKELSAEGMEAFVSGLGEPPYRARQILHWLYEKKAASIEAMTELSKPLRSLLSEVSYVKGLRLLKSSSAPDGTEKFCFGLQDGLSIESVLIPDGDRLTLCVSTQAGCAMGCRFCLTGKQGLKRNLKAFEIVEQVMAAPPRITNIVFMGMGEPMKNLAEVVEALKRLTRLMHISPRRITVSTSGPVKELLQFCSMNPAVNLAVSLNASTDAVRDRIMPVNRKYPLKELLKALKGIAIPKRRRITFEYVLLEGVNDSVQDAKRVVALLKGIPSKVNLIPFNEYIGGEFKRPSDERIFAFQEALMAGGLTAFIRKSKGGEVMAACGQLGSRTPS